MMKKLKDLVPIACVLSMLLSGVGVFAAGYDVIKEPYLESVTSTEIKEDSYYSYERKLKLWPTPFINGISTVYNDALEVPGEWVSYFCRGYYTVDEAGNVSELKNDLYNSTFGAAKIYDWKDQDSSEFYPDYCLEYPGKYGFTTEEFKSDKYFGTVWVDIYDQISGRHNEKPVLFNNLAIAARKEYEGQSYQEFQGGKTGIVDANENIIVPFIYDQILPVGSNGYTWVLCDDKWGIIKVNTDKITVNLNDKEIEFDQIPLIINGRTLAPLRAIFEALEATVEWDGTTQTITTTKGNTTVSMTIGKNELYKNGEMIWLDEAPQIIGERTLVPVRAIAESFDCNVDWNSETHTVTITN